MQDEPENRKGPGQALKAGVRNLDESESEEPSKGEIEETKKEEQAEDDPGELQEGVPMQDVLENGKGP